MTFNTPVNEDCGGIRLFVGLGNPGAEYEYTRHNAGFWWIDNMARQHGARFSVDKNYKAFVAKTVLDGKNIYFLKPLTFMNLSGQSVATLARFFKIAPEEVLIAHDELDIAPGLVKLKRGGGHAGHNGLRSIQAQLGSPDFWRLRLGIGHPGDKSEVASYVLRKPPLDEVIAIDRAIDCSLGVANNFLAGEFDAAQRVLHSHRP